MEQMHSHQEGIETSLKQTKSQLDKLYDEISRTLEKISSREKYLNNQLEHHLVEFRSMQDQLAETKERYRQASGGVTERTRKLAEVFAESALFAVSSFLGEAQILIPRTEFGRYVFQCHLVSVLNHLLVIMFHLDSFR